MHIAHLCLSECTAKQARRTIILSNNIGNRQEDSNGNTSTQIIYSAAAEIHLDEIDLQLIDLLMAGHTSRQSAALLDKPISTIQRRARLLIQKGAITPTFELGYSKLRVKRGFLHVYLNDGDISGITDKLLSRDGVFSVGVHLGNSDIVGQFVFQDSREVLGLIEWAKHLEGVGKVVWSEEVYAKSASPRLAHVLRKENGYVRRKASRTSTSKQVN